MNGRVYDPAVGRFLSVDPMFQAPTNTQSVNPYSYVMNNPLSVVDSTGYCGVTTADLDSNNSSICGSGGDDNGTDGVMTGSHIRGEDSGATCSGSCRLDMDGTGASNGAEYGSTGTNEPKGDNSSGSSNQGAPVNRELVKAAAAASDCAYGESSCKMPSGWSSASQDWLNTHSDISGLLSTKSGMSASVFTNDDTGAVIIAFKGTDSWTDTKTDIRQAVCLDARQYADAVALAGAVKASGLGDVTFTGHSLGGGLASIAALASGIHAITFNAAGISDHTLTANHLSATAANASQLIDRYYLRGDPLTFIQAVTPFPSALGSAHALNPTVGDALEDVVDPVHLHSISSVLDSLRN
jgi:hypothetical protein